MLDARESAFVAAIDRDELVALTGDLVWGIDLEREHGITIPRAQMDLRMIDANARVQPRAAPRDDA